MVLMSAGKMARNSSSLITRCQGGGPKKAGLPPSTGISRLSSKVLNTTFRKLPSECKNNQGSSACCNALSKVINASH